MECDILITALAKNQQYWNKWHKNLLNDFVYQRDWSKQSSSSKDWVTKGGYLVVEGSRAGLLASKEISSSQRFNPPFLIKCASDDVLTFKLTPSLKGYESGEVLSTGTIHGPVLTKRYRN